MRYKVFYLTLSIMFAFLSGVNAAEKKDTRKMAAYKVGLSCQNCVNTIQKNIAFGKGVEDLDIDLKSKTVVITYDSLKINSNVLKWDMENLGYSAEKISDKAIINNKNSKLKTKK